MFFINTITHTHTHISISFLNENVFKKLAQIISELSKL